MKILPLAIAGLRKRRQESRLLWAGFVIGTLLFTVTALLASSVLRTLAISRQDAYGEQKAVAYPAGEKERAALEAAGWARLETAYTVGLAPQKAGDLPLAVGYMGESARELAHIRLLAGRYPAARGEIAVEEAAAYRLGLDGGFTPGQHIELAVTGADGAVRPRVYTVVGVLADYTALWETQYGFLRDQPDAALPFLPPGALLSEEEFAAEGRAATAGLLLDARRSAAAALQYGSPEGVTLRANIRGYPDLLGLSPDRETMSSAAIFAIAGGVLLLGMAALILSAFLQSVERRRRQLALLRGVGATRSQANRLILAEAALLCLSALPVGLALGWAASYGAVRLLSAATELRFVYGFAPWTLAVAAGASLLTVLAAAWAPARRAARIPPVEGGRPSRPARAKRRRGPRPTPLYLACHTLWLSKGRLALSVVSFGLCLVLIGMSSVLFGGSLAEESKTLPVDFSLYVNRLGENARRDFVYPRDYRPELDAGFLEEIRTAAAPRSLTASVNPAFWLSLDKDKYDDYQEAVWMKKLEEKYGFCTQSGEDGAGERENEYLVSPVVTVYDDEALDRLADRVTAGRIDKEALRRGDEALLCASGFYKEVVEEEGGYSSHSAREPFPGGVWKENTTYAAGDTLPLSVIVGDISREDPLSPRVERVERRDVPVKIGAILEGGRAMELIVAEGAMEKRGLPFSYGGAEVYLPDNADIQEAEEAMNRLVRVHTGMSLLSKQEQAAQERQMRRIMVTAMAALTSCVGLVGVFAIWNTSAARIHHRRREMSLLRAMGMTRGQLTGLLAAEGLLTGLLAAVLGAAGTGVFLLAVGWELWAKYLSVPLLLAGGGLCALLCVLAVFLPAKQVLTAPPVEGVRQLD